MQTASLLAESAKGVQFFSPVNLGSLRIRKLIVRALQCVDNSYTFLRIAETFWKLFFTQALIKQLLEGIGDSCARGLSSWDCLPSVRPATILSPC